MNPDNFYSSHMNLIYGFNFEDFLFLIFSYCVDQTGMLFCNLVHQYTDLMDDWEYQASGDPAKMMLPTRVKCGLVATLITCPSQGQFTQISSVAERKIFWLLKPVHPFCPLPQGLDHFSLTIIMQPLKINHILTCEGWLLLGDHYCGPGQNFN